MTWQKVLLIAAVVLFIIAALAQFNVINGVNALALDSTGLACFAAAHL